MNNDFAFEYKDIYLSQLTTSKHTVVVLNALNELIQTHPNTVPVCIALSSFSLQEWALKARNEVYSNRDMNNALTGEQVMQQMLVELYDTPENITSKEHEKCIRASRELIELVKESFTALNDGSKAGKKMYDVMRFLHLGIETEKDYSDYSVRKYYREAILLISEGFSERIAENLMITADIFKSLNEEYKLVYHNTEILLTHYPDMKERIADIDDITELSDRHANLISRRITVANLVDTAVEKIKEYHIKGEVYYKILSGLKNRIYAKEQYEELGLERGVYYRERKKAIYILSLILWGYGIREIIDTIE